MEGNDKLKSSEGKFLRKNKKSQIWTKKALFEYFRLKFEKADVIFEIHALVDYTKNTKNRAKQQR